MTKISDEVFRQARANLHKLYPKIKYVRLFSLIGGARFTELNDQPAWKVMDEQSVKIIHALASTHYQALWAYLRINNQIPQQFLGYFEQPDETSSQDLL